jgi:hypothetical protein
MLPNKPLVTGGHCAGSCYAERPRSALALPPLGMSAGRRILVRPQAAAQRPNVSRTWREWLPSDNRRHACVGPNASGCLDPEPEPSGAQTV